MAGRVNMVLRVGRGARGRVAGAVASRPVGCIPAGLQNGQPVVAGVGVEYNSKTPSRCIFVFTANTIIVMNQYSR
jgi:hypothetical protein